MCESGHQAYSNSMSSRVANRLPRIGSLILGIRSNSQAKCREVWGCSNSSHPQRRISTLCGLAELLHCLQDPDVYPECPVVPVAPVSQCSTARHRSATRKQSGKQ
ncbi:hypothetical protein TNCT_193401 [Trichonephila clavata]|uniref:Uncharacterized protein n=1 Tax=Trichonephila clavata TaxID=2740835 RepID=A0A8X6GWN1_TRICU|nr:hypothetical protein TNCT_193401 [Trichonephila clavata]